VTATTAAQSGRSWRSPERLRTFSPVATSSRLERSANALAPIATNSCQRAVRRAVPGVLHGCDRAGAGGRLRHSGLAVLNGSTAPRTGRRWRRWLGRVQAFFTGSAVHPMAKEDKMASLLPKADISAPTGGT
jgi:hypothetical protein